MKRLNNKGVTLIELIVSFAIVSVAMVYFYQTLYTVRKLYVTAQTETQAFVDRDYAIRVVDSYIDKYGTSNLSDLCSTYNLKYSGKGNCKNISTDDSSPMKVTIEWGENSNKKTISFYKTIAKSFVKNYVPILSEGNSGGISSLFFNGENIKKGNVKTITFVSTLDTPSGYSDFWDASLNKDGSVIAWYKSTGEKSSDNFELYDLIIGGAGKVQFPPNSSYLFSSFQNLVEINFNGAIDTTNSTYMYNMFDYCEKLQSIDLNDFYTKNVVDMSSMFSGCTNLEELKNIHKLETENVTSMYYMFFHTALKELDLSNFDTSKVTNMQAMFYACSNLSNLILGDNFDTSLVTNMTKMFASCEYLTKLEFNNHTNKNFVTSSVTDMSEMFYFCSKLETLDLSNFNTSLVTNMTRMFASCESLTKLEFNNHTNKNFVTSSVIDMSSMFNGCEKLNTLDLSNFNTSLVTNMTRMFSGCKSLTKLEFNEQVNKNFKPELVTNFDHMFAGCTGLTKLDLANFKTVKAQNLSGMFYNCSGLSSITNLDVIITRNVTNMSSMFAKCSKFEILNLESFDMSGVKNMSSMFNDCTGLKSIVLTSFITSSADNMSKMFYNCKSLTNLDLSKFYTDKVTDMSYMFSGCESLGGLDLSNFRLTKISKTGIGSMFTSCKKLAFIDIRNFDFSKVSSLTIFRKSIFDGVPTSTKIYVNSSGSNYLKKVGGRRQNVITV